MSTSSQSRPAAPAGRDDQAFPELTDDQLERIQAFGQVESLEKGTEVFWRGQRQADFFVLLEGSIEVFDYNCDGETQVFTTHRARQFTGEIDLFSDRKVLVGGRTGEDSRVVRLNRSQ
ncbi:MAG: cyclic nucleotide-binding domain-containing protein, partial [Planctomycetota bacterium]